MVLVKGLLRGLSVDLVYVLLSQLLLFALAHLLDQVSSDLIVIILLFLPFLFNLIVQGKLIMKLHLDEMLFLLLIKIFVFVKSVLEVFLLNLILR